MSFLEGRWYFSPDIYSWCYRPAGEYDLSVIHTSLDDKYVIRGEEIHQLMLALDEAGWIKPRLDERLRTEDLKITHRLLDILESKVSSTVQVDLKQ